MVHLLYLFDRLLHVHGAQEAVLHHIQRNLLKVQTTAYTRPSWAQLWKSKNAPQQARPPPNCYVASSTNRLHCFTWSSLRCFKSQYHEMMIPKRSRHFAEAGKSLARPRTKSSRPNRANVSVVREWSQHASKKAKALCQPACTCTNGASTISLSSSLNSFPSFSSMAAVKSSIISGFSGSKLYTESWTRGHTVEIQG